jgi:hypothetical protein
MGSQWDDTQADRLGRAVWLIRAIPSVAVVAFVAGAVWAVWEYRFQFNADGISYISIAEKYATGDLFGAVNAYWSPLYSWLLVPFLWSGVPAFLATKVLGVALGACLILVARQIAGNLGLRPGSCGWLTVTLVPVALYLAVWVITPDLLAAVVGLAYLRHITSPRYLDGRWSRTIAGILGGVGYLAKAYLGGFFLAHFLLAAVLDTWLARQSRGRALRGALAGVLAFGVVSGSWMAALIGKYGLSGVSSPGAYNHAFNGPDCLGHPTHTHGFLPQSNPTAISAWEDPTDLPMTDWSALDSPRNFRYQLYLLARNAGDVGACINWYSIFGSGTFAVAGLVLTSRRQPQPYRPAVLLFAAVAVFPLGYLPLHVEGRFLILMAVLLFLLGLFLIDSLEVGRLGRYHRPLALAVLCGSFAFNPSWKMWSSRGVDRATFVLSESLADVFPAGARVASNGNWGNTLGLAYHRRLKYYGEPRPGATPAEIEAELRRHGIDYVLIWGDPWKCWFGAGWPEVSGGRVDGLTVRRVPRGELR